MWLAGCQRSQATMLPPHRLPFANDAVRVPRSTRRRLKAKAAGGCTSAARTTRSCLHKLRPMPRLQVDTVVAVEIPVSPNLPFVHFAPAGTHCSWMRCCFLFTALHKLTSWVLTPCTRLPTSAAQAALT